MLTKDETVGGRQSGIAVALLATGIAIGWLISPLIPSLQPEGDSPTRVADPPPELAARFEAPESPEAPPDNGLPSFHLELTTSAAGVLQGVRTRAMERGIIQQEDTDTVDCRLSLDGTEHPATARIKGDWLDHVSSDKWSLRFTLDDTRLLGMRVFSIQTPETRGGLWEWVLHEAARREGLLAPRSFFVNLVINGNPNGVYFLEEHFGTEMLEAQQRRDGPIVRFDESTLWSRFLSNQQGALPVSTARQLTMIDPAALPQRANVRAYSEKHLASVAGLNRALVSALDKIRDIQRLVLIDNKRSSRLRRLTALEALEGRTIDQFIDTAEWARAHALVSLFQAWHGQAWHNQRLYLNPVTDRLEPILFDNIPLSGSDNPFLVLENAPYASQIAKSQDYYGELFRQLARMTEPSWLEDLFEALGPQLTINERALDSDESRRTAYDPARMKQHLHSQQILLRKYIEPADPVNFLCFFAQQEQAGQTIGGQLEVEAWATSRLPVWLLGFRFKDGSFRSASDVVVTDGGAAPASQDPDVFLPSDGRPVHFSFDANQRLANLSNIQALKTSLRDGKSDRDGIQLDEIMAVYRTVPEQTPREEPLIFYNYDRSMGRRAGRPEPVSMEAALARHDCLNYDVENDRLKLRPGPWDVRGDLVIPEGVTLHAWPTTVLRFEPGAVLFSDAALDFQGVEGFPVVLEPAEEEGSWGGVVVLQASERSDLVHTVVRRAAGVARGGWMTSSGMTFFHSEVYLTDCRVEDSPAEDGLNIFGSKLRMLRVLFSGCASDSFDGDFVTGTIKDCDFRDGGADGLDVSGSYITVGGCRFTNLADKALSVGEASTANLSNLTIDGVNIGIAAKDSSEVVVRETTLRNVRFAGLTAFIKKQEFGPASIAATGLTFGNDVPRPFLSQTGSVVTWDGEPIPTEDLDVDALYER
jgi:hypothetical protein